VSEAALFVGGPWDGQHRMLERASFTFEVAVVTLTSANSDYREERVTYHRVTPMGRVFYLAEPDRLGALGDKSAVERLLDALRQGYRVPL
jgi:hypothetical protein